MRRDTSESPDDSQSGRTRAAWVAIAGRWRAPTIPLRRMRAVVAV